jgi:hypothetical protein
VGVAGRRIEGPRWGRASSGVRDIRCAVWLAIRLLGDTSYDDAGGTNMIVHKSEPHDGIEGLSERVRVLLRPAVIGAQGH